MCVVEVGGCGCTGARSIGVSARGIVMALVVAASVVATYRVLEVAWPFLLTLWALAALYVWVPAARPAMRAAAVSPVLLVAWWLRRRRTEPAATAALAASRSWKVTVYRPVGGTNEVITDGVVEGAWASKTEVEAETIHRAVARFGWDQAGELRAHAQLVTR